jgi:hypothetical protein
MRREDIRAYLDRDWDRVAEAKRLRWRERRAHLGAAEAIRVAAELYEQIRRVRPDWPSAESRRADLEHHLRLSERLRAVGRR